MDYITIFAKSATGDVEPSTLLNLGDKGRSFAIDDAGRLILVADDREIVAYPPPYSETNDTSLGFIDSREFVQEAVAGGDFLYFTDLQHGDVFVYSLQSSTKDGGDR